jgi:hypothetical protein
MIKRIAIIILIFVLFSIICFAINTPALHTDGKNIKDPSGNIVILRGLSFVSVWNIGEREGPRYTYYSTQFPVADQINRIKAMIELSTDSTKGWYARVLRFPVYPTAQDADPGWTLCDATKLATYKTLLQTCIDYATSKGVYCIIDWHYIANYGDKLAATQAFWDYAAPTYKNYTNVMFEIYNEPIYDNDTNKSTSWTTWKTTIAQPVVDRIRNTHGATNLILVGSPNWSQMVAPIASAPVSGTNIVYVAHIYPYHYDTDNTLASYIGTTKDVYPVFFTEWGFQNGAAMPCDSPNEDGYATGMKNYFNTNGNSWTGWCFDPYWQPIMWSNWDYISLLGTSLPSTGGYQGQYIKDFLNEKKDSNLPGGGGGGDTPAPTNPPSATPDPTAVPGDTAVPTATPAPTSTPAPT